MSPCAPAGTTRLLRLCLTAHRCRPDNNKSLATQQPDQQSSCTPSAESCHPLMTAQEYTRWGQICCQQMLQPLNESLIERQLPARGKRCTCGQRPPARRHSFHASHTIMLQGSSTGPHRSRSSTGFHTVNSHPRTSHRHHLASYMEPPLKYSFGYTWRGRCTGTVAHVCLTSQERT